MEVDLVQTSSIEAGKAQVLKHSFDLILVPAPGTSPSSEPAYSSELIRWDKEVKKTGIPVPILLYFLFETTIAITDISAGLVSIDHGAGASRSLILTLRQAASRSRLERSFRSGYDLHSKVIADMPLAYIKTESGKIAGVNTAMEIMSGRSREDLMDTSISDLIIPGIEHGDSWYQASLQMAGGRNKPVRVYIPVTDNLVDPPSQILFLEDRQEIEDLITNLRETEQTCREKLWLAEALVMKMAPDGMITFANSATLRCFGYSGQGLEGHHISLLLPPGIEPESASPINLFLGVANESEPTAIHIMEHLHNDGGKIYIAWTTRAYYTSSGELAGLLCIGTDMTEHTPEGEGRISTRIWRDRVLEGTDIRPEVFDAILQACVEIAREGREGKPLGTAFLVGDRDAVMERSRQLILNPFFGHPPAMRTVINKDVREMLKEYALLDGAFVVSGDGILEAAGRYITVDASFASLPKGMGTRHSSTAAISSITHAVGLVVSESGGRVSVIKDGKIVKVIG